MPEKPAAAAMRAANRILFGCATPKFGIELSNLAEIIVAEYAPVVEALTLFLRLHKDDKENALAWEGGYRGEYVTASGLCKCPCCVAGCAAMALVLGYEISEPSVGPNKEANA